MLKNIEYVPCFLSFYPYNFDILIDDGIKNKEHGFYFFMFTALILDKTRGLFL